PAPLSPASSPLSLHDALPISRPTRGPRLPVPVPRAPVRSGARAQGRRAASAAEDDRSRRRLVDPEGAAELAPDRLGLGARGIGSDRKSTRLNSSHQIISYAVF